MNVVKGDPSHAKFMIGIVLSILTLVAYWEVAGNGFINYDDQAYVTWNRHVQNGLTLEGIGWAFTTTSVYNWHPMMWLSLMLDWELYGMNAGGYHWTSVILHLVTGLLLFFVLEKMTGKLWRSGLVAGLFLLHPLHVESVAWVSERKDVLSGLFWMLTLWGYAWYVEKPCWERYLMVLLSFAMGLMSKPMVVTLPFVLLLLDYWPLERFQSGKAWSLLKEKAPLFILSAISSLITFLVQREGGAVETFQTLPLTDRLGNAVVSYGRYLVKMIWPYDLAIFYIHPGSWPIKEILLSLSLVLIITGYVIIKRVRVPYLPVGWLWYLGALVPVIGLVQVGAQAMADRYAYLPLIGIYLILVWGAADILWKQYFKRIVGCCAVVIAISLMMITTRVQVGYWNSSLTLFEHALRVTQDNYQALNNLGRALAAEGRYREAEESFLSSIRMKPEYIPPYLNLGLLLMEKGWPREAMAYVQGALRIKPGDGEVLLTRGNLFLKQEKWDEAIADYRQAMPEKPHNATLHNNLGLALTHKGMVGPAIESYRQAIRFSPDHAGAHNNLAMLLIGSGKTAEAIFHLREAVRLQPDFLNAHLQLAQLLRRQGLAQEAAFHFREVRRIQPNIEIPPISEKVPISKATERH